jgi:hypothetical protein
MSFSIDYVRQIQGAQGLTNIKQVLSEEAKSRIELDMLESISCQYDSKRNDVSQKFVVTDTDIKYCKNILAFPSESLNIGDIIDCFGQKWIVTDVSADNTIQYSGKMYQCNLALKFQVGTGTTIYTRYGYLDNGVFSTTTKETQTMQIGDLQFNLVLPYDTYTRTLQRDKRIATEVIYRPDGAQVLKCFKVTSGDSISGSFGSGKKWQIKLREDEYNAQTDSIANMVCDYHAATPSTDPIGGGWV